MSALGEITKEMFEEYKKIQAEGKYNMLSPEARKLSTLDKRQWYAIISNYDYFNSRYIFLNKHTEGE